MAKPDDFIALANARKRAWIGTYQQVHSKSELTSYLDSGCVDEDLNMPLDILQYWKAQSVAIPTLASLARDILTVAISGTGVEWLFNFGRDVIGYCWCQLKGETIEALLMLKYNFQKVDLLSSPPGDLQDLLEPPNSQLNQDSSDNKETPIFELVSELNYSGSEDEDASNELSSGESQDRSLQPERPVRKCKRVLDKDESDFSLPTHDNCTDDTAQQCIHLSSLTSPPPITHQVTHLPKAAPASTTTRGSQGKSIL